MLDNARNLPPGEWRFIFSKPLKESSLAKAQLNLKSIPITIKTAHIRQISNVGGKLAVDVFIPNPFPVAAAIIAGGIVVGLVALGIIYDGILEDIKEIGKGPLGIGLLLLAVFFVVGAFRK